jgi:hypothetical protein
VGLLEGEIRSCMLTSMSVSKKLKVFGDGDSE